MDAKLFEKEAAHGLFPHINNIDDFDSVVLSLTTEYIIVSNTEYNYEAVEAFKALGGLWSPSGSHWYFSTSNNLFAHVETVLTEYYGEYFVTTNNRFPEPNEYKYIAEVLEYHNGEIAKKYVDRRKDGNR